MMDFKERAQRGAAARWDKAIPLALLGGKLTLGNVEVDCYVTDNGERLIAGRGMQEILRLVDEGLPESGQKPGSRLTRLLNNKKLKPLIHRNKSPDHFLPKKRRYKGRLIAGYNAEMLVDICEGILEARRQKLPLTPRQHVVAAQCELILRGLAKTGIVALIDEATGYQILRPADALKQYLSQILRDELAAWIKRFPDEFYENIYKLKGWEWPGMSKNRYSVVAHYTNDWIYERLAPGLREELQRLSPKNAKGQRDVKLFQWLNEDGIKLHAQQMFAVLMIQRAALNRGGNRWNAFMDLMDEMLPKRGSNLPLPFPIPDQTT